MLLSITPKAHYYPLSIHNGDTSRKWAQYKAYVVRDEMTPRERAHIGPRTLKDVNSEEYAWQTTAYLKTLYGLKEASVNQWIAALEEAEQHHIYDLIPPEKPYGSMDALLVAEIGETAASSTATVMAHSLEAQGKTYLDPGPRTAEERANVDVINIRETGGGTSAKYLTARIARKRPDVLARMQMGDFSSVRAAAKEAGLVKNRISISLEPNRAARAIRRHFDDAGVAA